MFMFNIPRIFVWDEIFSSCWRQTHKFTLFLFIGSCKRGEAWCFVHEYHFITSQLNFDKNTKNVFLCSSSIRDEPSYPILFKQREAVNLSLCLHFHPQVFVFQHETASLDMFDHLVESNGLKVVMEEHGLVLPEDLDFIKEQIAGPLSTQTPGQKVPIIHIAFNFNPKCLIFFNKCRNVQIFMGAGCSKTTKIGLNEVLVFAKVW